MQKRVFWKWWRLYRQVHYFLQLLRKITIDGMNHTAFSRNSRYWWVYMFRWIENYWYTVVTPMFHPNAVVLECNLVHRVLSREAKKPATSRSRDTLNLTDCRALSIDIIICLLKWTTLAHVKTTTILTILNWHDNVQ